MANIKTVREIKKVLDDEGGIDINNLSKYIRDNLSHIVPELESWKCELNSGKIDFYPGDSWKTKDDYICIRIDLPYGNDVFECDPWVGVYVPEDWKKRDKFYEKLDKTLLRGFKNSWEEPDDESPLWAHVYYKDYAKGDSFDVNGFVENIAKLVVKLVKIKDKIDSIIKQVQK